jgi:hypothetical protein
VDRTVAYSNPTTLARMSSLAGAIHAAGSEGVQHS